MLCVNLGGCGGVGGHGADGKSIMMRCRDDFFFLFFWGGDGDMTAEGN